MCEWIRFTAALIAWPMVEAIDFLDRRKHRIWWAKYEAARIDRASGT